MVKFIFVLMFMESQPKTDHKILPCLIYWSGIIKVYKLVVLKKKKPLKTASKLIWIWFQDNLGKVKLNKVILITWQITFKLI